MKRGLNALVALITCALGTVAIAGCGGQSSQPNDTSSPIVSFDKPRDRSEIQQGTVQVQLKASDDTKVQSIEISVDGKVETTLDSAPWTWDWNTGALEEGTYTLKAVATDPAGNKDSDTIEVSVISGCESGQDCPGSQKGIEITSPAAGAKVCESVSIAAVLAGVEGVERVEFSVDGQLLGKVETSPYRINWETRNVNDGSHTIEAKAILSSSDPVTTSRSVEVDNGSGECDNAPAIQITNPAPGGFHSGKVNVTAEASDDGQIRYTRFLIDGTRIVTDKESPYKFVWQADLFAEGSYVLTAVAKDGGGKTASHSVNATLDRTAPSVRIKTPKNGAVFQDSIETSLEASDNFELRSVDVSIDDGQINKKIEKQPWEANFDISELTAGPHKLNASAVDRAGQKTSKSVDFKIDRPPTVEFTSPDAETTHKQPVKLEFDANDDLGIAELELRVDDNTIKSLEPDEQSFEWAPGKDHQGEQTVVALVTDTGDHTARAKLKLTFECKQTWYPDRDGDSFGDPTSPKTVETCKSTPPDGFVSDDTDCNDSAPNLYPGAAKNDSASKCMQDRDGDGYGAMSPDSGGKPGTDCNDDNPDQYRNWEMYPDKDNDGYGTGTKQDVCGADKMPDVGWSDQAGDCNDEAPDAYPGAATEDSDTKCLKDADQDGFGDSSPPRGVEAGTDCNDGDPAKFKTWNVYKDEDGDDWGAGAQQSVCGGSDVPADWAKNNRDCDDNNANIKPGAAPEDSTSKCMKDSDGDGYGDDSPPSGVEAGTDCNDADPGKFKTWQAYEDNDGDGWGTGSKTPVCGHSSPPSGWAEKVGDCVETDPDTHPGAAPQDHNSKCMQDEDGDDFGDANPPTGAEAGSDCDDNAGHTYPGAAPKDGASACLKDKDGDEYGDANPPEGVESGTDCDDEGPDTFPGAALDDSQTDCMKDADDDGYGDASVPASIEAGTDCDDDNDAVNPGALDLCDEIDNNCSGVVDEGCSCDYKGKSVGVCLDGQIGSENGECKAPDSYESPEVSVDSKDNDCDGQVDESQ